MQHLPFLARARQSTVSLTSTAAALAVLAACSANSNESTFSKSGNGQGGQGSGQGNGEGGAIQGGDGGSGATDGSAIGIGQGGAGGSGETCAADSTSGEVWPLDMYIMMDQSGSMANPFGMSLKTKWQAVTQGLTSFLNGQPANADIGVGIQFFPLAAKPWSAFQQCPNNNECSSGETCVGTGYANFCLANCSGSGDCPNGDECVALDTVSVCSNDLCDPGAYASPEVPVELLSNNKSAVIAAMQSHQPCNSTPTGSAVEGAMIYAKSRAQAYPDRKVVVVLATDGQPTDCPGTGQPAAGTSKAKQLAAEALAGSPPVMTFVIGTIDPGDLQGLGACNDIAQAGGTGQALIMKQNQPLDQQFSDALAKIKGSAVGCEYKIPDAQGGNADLGKVNVVYTIDAGPEGTVYYVEDASQCDPVDGGWHYDVKPSEGNPTAIVLCPSTCEMLQKPGQQVSVSIQIGCKTQVMPPK